MSFSRFTDSINRPINHFMDPVSSGLGEGLLYAFLVLYASLAAPNLPASALKIIDTFWFKLLFIALLFWVSLRNPVLSILLALAYLTSLNAIAGKQLFENFVHS